MLEYVDTFGKPSKRPTDQLACLLWIQMHPLAGLDQITDAAWKGAQFKYARKTETHITGLEPEVLRAKAAEGRDRVAREKRDREARERDGAAK